jgi:hypothetical protein
VDENMKNICLPVKNIRLATFLVEFIVSIGEGWNFSSIVLGKKSTI